MITLNVDFYNTNGLVDRRDGFNYRITGNPSLTSGELKVPSGFSYGNFEDDQRQPFNKIGISPEYRWATLHLGYRNLSYSPLTLNNRTFLGAGVELRPGLFRFSAMYGRFQRGIEQDLESPAFRQFPAYRQTGFASSVGVGSENNYLDLIVLQIEDDSASIDTPEVFGLYPKSNSVAGISSKLRFTDKLSWNNDLALSVMTRDQRADEIDDEAAPQLVSNLVQTLKANLSTNLQQAIRSEIQFREKNFSIGATYERVDPEYRSLGTYFFNNDLERLTLNPSVRLLGRRLRLNARLGLQRDNLQNTLAKSTARTAILLNSFFIPNDELQLSFSYSNLNSRQQIERALMSDTIQLAYVSQNSSLNVTRIFKGLEREHRVKLLAGFNAMQNDSDQRVESKAFRAGLGYMLKLKSKDLSIAPEFMVYVFDNERFDQTNIRYSLRLSKSWNKNKVRMTLNNNYITSHQEGNAISSTLQNFLIGSYRLDRAHTLGIRYRILSINAKDASRSDLLEGMGGFFYRINLSQLN
jgi:hypothetical protein